MLFVFLRLLRHFVPRNDRRKIVIASEAKQSHFFAKYVRFAQWLLRKPPSTLKSEKPKKLTWSDYAAIGMRLIAAGLTIFFAVQYVIAAKSVTDRNVNEPTYAVIGKIVGEKLPSNACLLLDETDYGHHFFLMFHSGLSSYLLRDRDMNTSAEQARQSGAIPYLVTRKTYDYPLVFEDTSRTPYRVYLLNGDKPSD